MKGNADTVHESMFLPFQDNQRAVSDGRWKLHVYPKINHRRVLDVWQPKWICDKYFDGRDNPNRGPRRAKTPKNER